MKITINFSDGIISIPYGVLDKIESIGETELKLLLYICREMGKPLGDFKTEAAATTLGFSKNDVENALSFLRGAGFIKTSGKSAPAKDTPKKAPPQEEGPKLTIISNSPPQYSGPELDRLVHEKKVLDNLRKECENLFGKPLNPAQLNKLVTLYDYFGFDEAYILQLLAISKDKSRPIDYAYSFAVKNYEKNIVTYEGLLEELRRLDEQNSFENKMKKLFGIEKRSLTTKEKNFFEIWQGYDGDLVTYAYELTVDSTGKASMPYMNKILTNFAEQGIKSVEAAKEHSAKHKADKMKQPSESGFDEEEFFEIALENTYKKYKKPTE